MPQHRLTRTQHLIYRVDSPEGVTRWAASSARWQPWHQARPSIRARVITANGREHALDQKLLKDSGTRNPDGMVYDDDHVFEGPLPAVEIGAVIEEEIVVRDEQPFFAAGSVFREFVGRPVPVQHTRVIIDVPEGLPLRRLTRLLPNAQVTESRTPGRVRWTYEIGPLDEIRTLESNLPPETPAWPSIEFSSAKSWEAVAESYRAATESRIRTDDARPLIAGLRAPVRGSAVGSGNAGAALGAKLTAGLPNSPTREYISKVVERLHREVRYTGVEFGAARPDPRVPGRNAAPQVRRLQGQVGAAGRGAARFGHRGLPCAARRGRRTGRVAGAAGPRHVRPRHRLSTRRRRRRRGPVDRRHRRIRARGHAARGRRRPARADHPSRREGADAHAALRSATTARSRRASSSCPSTARREWSRPPRRTASSRTNIATGTRARTRRSGSTSSRTTCARPIARRRWSATCTPRARISRSPIRCGSKCRMRRAATPISKPRRSA